MNQRNLEGAVELLLWARKLQNQTVVDHHEMGRLRFRMDEFLKGFPGDDPADRYDAPHRVEARKFISRLFWRRK